MESHHTAMFGAHWLSSSEDTVLTSQNHKKEGSCNFMSGNFSSLYVTTLPRLVAINIVVVRYVFSLSRDLARLCDLMVLQLYG